MHTHLLLLVDSMCIVRFGEVEIYILPGSPSTLAEGFLHFTASETDEKCCQRP